MNELDHAIVAMQRSSAGAAEFYRQIARGELCFLLPYHPELEGAQMQIETGSPFPFFVQTESDGREVVPIFSAAARVEESLRSRHVPARKFLCGTMPAIQVLELIGQCGFAAVLNRGCTTGELTLPAELLCDIADGSIFQPSGPAEANHAAVTLLDAADYPTDLVQRAFEFVRQHREFRAAWVFLLPGAPGAPALAKYQLIFLMSPRDSGLLQDLNLALHCQPGPGVPFESGTVDETDTVQIVTLFARAAPFYLAQDYPRPRS